MIVSSRICRNTMTTCAGGSQPTRGISRPPSALTGAPMSAVVHHLLLPSCCPFPSIKGAWNQPWMKMGLQDTLILPSSNWPACWKNSFSTQHSLGIGWMGWQRTECSCLQFHSFLQEPHKLHTMKTVEYTGQESLMVLAGREEQRPLQKLSPNSSLPPLW